LQVSSSGIFRIVVPFLLLIACGLLAFQRPLASRVQRRGVARGGAVALDLDLAILAAACGAYLGAAMGVLVLAVLAVLLSDTLQRLNALKSYISLVVNVLAAILVAFIAPVHWEAVALMMPASLIGGRGGATLAMFPGARGVAASRSSACSSPCCCSPACEAARLPYH
jgi:hypothetical protein